MCIRDRCVLTILELNWNQCLGHKKTKLNICHHMLKSSTQLQNMSFHVVERTRTSSKCQKMKNARAKRAKLLFFIVKCANLWGFCCRRSRGCSLLYVRVVVKTAKNLVILFYYFVDDGTELFFKRKACCKCSMIIFSHSTNEILSLCRCRSRCQSSAFTSKWNRFVLRLSQAVGHLVRNGGSVLSLVFQADENRHEWFFFFSFKARETVSAVGSRCRQNLKFENFTWLFRRLRQGNKKLERHDYFSCLLYTSPSPRDA